MNQALCMGINNYPGSGNDLSGCVNDSYKWQYRLSTFPGYDRVIRITDDLVLREGLRQNVLRMARDAYAGDWVVIQYSGHGTQTVDMSGDEPDGYDEALYLYDGIFTDDEFRELLKNFRPGVHIVVILDSCFSGTMTRKPRASLGRAKFIPTYEIPPKLKRRKQFLAEEDMVEILMSGCSDSEYSYDAYIDGAFTGAFTHYALKAFSVGMTFKDWHETIKLYLPSTSYPQTPQLEGSAANKKLIAFGATAEEEPPDELPEPVPDVTPDNIVYYLAAGAFIVFAVILYFILKGC